MAQLSGNERNRTPAPPPRPRLTHQGATDSNGLGFSDYAQGTHQPGSVADHPYVAAPNNLTPTGGLPLPTLPSNRNPYGGVPGGGGGGGGAKPPNWDAIYGLIGMGKPQQYQYQDLEWDPTQYNIARQTVTDQIGAGRSSGNQTYDDTLYELNQYQNPYGNVRTTNPGVRDAMSRMMQANGIDPNINAQVDWEGQQADDAFGYTQALLAGAADQRQGSNVRALGGDRRRFNEGLDSEGRLLGAGVDLASARAQGENARTNNQGRNQAGLFNTQASNDWMQGSLAPLLELLMSGEKGIDPWKLMVGLQDNAGLMKAFMPGGA